MFGSCLIYWTRRNHQYGLRLEDMYLELNAFPDLESNSGPFDLEPTALTVIPPCFSLFIIWITIICLRTIVPTYTFTNFLQIPDWPLWAASVYSGDLNSELVRYSNGSK